jgi:hypothetical protein
MSQYKHTTTPWEVDKLAVVSVVELNDYGDIICEAPTGYDHSMIRWDANAARIVQCVNEYDELIETIATIRAEKAELIVLASKMKEGIDEVLEVLDGNGVPNIQWVKNSLLNQSITLAKYEMTVKQLIEQLSILDQDKIVIITEPDGKGWDNIGIVIEQESDVAIRMDGNGLFQES